MNLGDFSIVGGTNGGNKVTWEGDYGFIYEFIRIIERLLQVILNFINGLGSGNTTTPDTEGGAAGGEGDAVVPNA